MILKTKHSREAWLAEEDGTSYEHQETKKWSMIWHMQVPSKLKVFVWQLARHSMPTGSVLKRRHMATDDTCSLCGATDTWKHALIACPMATSVWALAPDELVQHMVEREEDGPKEWLFSLHELLTNDLFDRLVVMLWALWYARRKAIHENIFQSPHSVNSFISKYLDELQVTHNRQPSKPPPTSARPARWLAPPSGNAKFNVDAAVTRNGGTVGVICRDDRGMFMGASTLSFRYIVDPPTLEALAIREALALADDLYLRRIQVASDCKTVVQDIHKENLASYGAVIHEIVEHSLAFDFCNFSHEFRSSNFEAHNLAKHALSLGGGRHVWLGHLRNLPSVPVNIVTT